MSDSLWLWIGFNAFVLAMLALDLFVFHRGKQQPSIKDALVWSVVWTVIAFAFNAGVFLLRGQQAGLEFLTGYVLERSLSVDNLFVFLLVFGYFGVKPELQHKVLFWGIVGALVMRMVFIFAGVALIERFHWVLYLMGLILVVSGIRMFFQDSEAEVHPEKNPIVRLFRKFVPVTPRFHGEAFFVMENGRRFATPLFIVLLVIESTDVVFAVDSIPAVLAVTQDPFIVYSSNIFAILGMRALYFALAGVMGIFHYLHYGLSLILVFVGVKMLGEPFFHIPIGWALAVVGVTLAASVVASLIWRKKVAEQGLDPDALVRSGHDDAVDV
jgi:tellurite resistance protein TerC